MEAYLNACGVLIKDFGTFAQKLSAQVRAGSYQLAESCGRPLEYLSSNQRSKEQIAKQIAERDKVQSGLIVILSAIEPCQSFSVRGQRQTKEIHLVLEMRKCLFFYHYFLHPIFGFMHARVQSWFPFTIDFCLNGREWLAKQMDKAGIGYRRRENCFVAIDDWQRAQQLAERQLQTDWPKNSPPFSIASIHYIGRFVPLSASNIIGLLRPQSTPPILPFEIPKLFILFTHGSSNMESVPFLVPM